MRDPLSRPLDVRSARREVRLRRGLGFGDLRRLRFPSGGGRPHGFECLLNVSHQVLVVLHADRESDEAGSDALALAILRFDVRMGHGGRVLRQGLRAPETHGQADELERVQKLEGGILAARDLERDQGARRDALLSVHLEHRVFLSQKPEVVDAPHLGMIV